MKFYAEDADRHFREVHSDGQEAHSDQQEALETNCNETNSDTKANKLDTRIKFFTTRIINNWDRLPREVGVDFPSLKRF